MTQLPHVTAFASTSLGIVNAGYVLAFLWMAIMVMGRDTIQAKVGPSSMSSPKSGPASDGQNKVGESSVKGVLGQPS